MNALNLARTAYSAAAAPIRTHQSTEYEALARVTGRLKSTAANRTTSFPDFAAALYDNRRLWLLLATDVADPANGLPDQLRAQVIYLSEFTSQHTGQVLGGSASVDALVDINTAVMRGLRLQEARR